MKSNLLPIAKEGWNYILYALGIFLLALLFDFDTIALIAFVSLAFLGYSFRNPERELLVFEEKSVVSPLDGVVTMIEEIDKNEYFYKVTIESTYSDVSVLRAPMNAEVKKLEKFKGSRLSFTNELSHKINERACLVFEDSNDNTVQVIHILKQSFCGINLDSLLHRNLLRSQRYGVMVNGISEVYLPKNFRLNITLGEELKASQTLLGYFS